MSRSETLLRKSLLANALHWFLPHFRQRLVTPIEGQFPNWPLTREIQDVLSRSDTIVRAVEEWPKDEMSLGELIENLATRDPQLLPLLKRIILHYRRDRAAYIERLTEKTFHLQLTEVLEEEVKALDALARAERFVQIEEATLPRLRDFLPVQYIESAEVSPLSLAPRQYDEKFHILQAPHLFLPDLAYFRSKCEDRDAFLAIGFVDIDDFKTLNSRYTESKVDRNLLPRFMQAIEAHVFHHGYAYRQGGDEYLILVPSLSRPLSISFLDELRHKLAALSYPDLAEATTVSIGLCIVNPDCPLTDRELRDKANQAKEFAKKQGKNCIATYHDFRLNSQELEVVKSSLP